jgi:hypothetical protein
MAKKRTKDRQSAARAVTFERSARLCRLLHILSGGSQSRQSLIKQLRLDVRGFYRDLELLRSAGIGLPLIKGRYELGKPLNQLLPRLPFPDPGLTLGDAMQLAKGRTAAHSKLRKQIARIMR